jgi:hypothetical protein
VSSGKRLGRTPPMCNRNSFTNLARVSRLGAFRAILMIFFSPALIANPPILACEPLIQILAFLAAHFFALIAAG